VSKLKHHIQETIGRLAKARVGIVGDLVADIYISGLSERVSREAPVLIVRYEKEWLRPGGAANVAANVAALGASACVIGFIGDDDAGRRLSNCLIRGGDRGRVNFDYACVTANRETITKTRLLAGAKLTSRQQVLRLDRQPIQAPDDRLIDQLIEQVRKADRHVDAWVASDYGYGSFNEPLRVLLREIARHKPVVADSRWDLTRFTGMTIIKPNEEEAEAAARELGCMANDPNALALALAERLQAQSSLITLGNEGMVLADKGKVMRISASGSDEIVDLTGAGDSVAATLTTAIACGATIEIAARLANHAGGIVVMKEGAATASTEELTAALDHSQDDL